MTGSGETINRGPAPPRDREEDRSIMGNARRKGEDPSPDDRGETSSADAPPAADFDSARDRAR